MTETTSHIGTETIAPESHFEPRRYRVRYMCSSCACEFTRTFAVVPKKDPPCPRPECRDVTALAQKDREIARLQAMLVEQRAPAQIGANVQVRAIDATAEIVMQDHKLTDLKDNIRSGESMTPPLPLPQQRQADNYFGQSGTSAVDFVTGQRRAISKAQMDRISRRAVAGAYRGMAVSQKDITPDAAQGSPALTSVGERANDFYRGQRR